MLEQLLPFLDIAVWEVDDKGSWKQLAPLPSWFSTHYGGPNTQGSPQLDSPFLSDFFLKATEFWSAGQEGSIASGPWTEADHSGTERMLQAMAILSGGRRILLIEPARVPLEEAQVLLQKGRQKNLDFRTVKRKQRSLRKVQQRYLTLLDAVPDWVLVVHQDGSLLEYSAGREDLFGDIRLEVGKNIQDLLPPDISGQLLPQAQNVISSGRPQMWRYRDPSRVVEVLVMATGEDEALCILRPKTGEQKDP